MSVGEAEEGQWFWREDGKRTAKPDYCFLSRRVPDPVCFRAIRESDMLRFETFLLREGWICFIQSRTQCSEFANISSRRMFDQSGLTSSMTYCWCLTDVCFKNVLSIASLTWVEYLAEPELPLKAPVRKA